MKSKFFILKVGENKLSGNLLRINTGEGYVNKIKDMHEEYRFDLIDFNKNGAIYNIYKEIIENLNIKEEEFFQQDMERTEKSRKMEYLGRIFLDTRGNLSISPKYRIKKIYLTPASKENIDHNNLERIIEHTVSTIVLN